MAPTNGPMNRLLYCEACNFIQFSSYSEFRRHHLEHIRQPSVNLTRLSDSLVSKLTGGGSYRVYSGVARKSVPPIKLSVVKQTDGERFLVIKKKEKPWSNNSRSSPNRRHSSSCEPVASTSAMEREEDVVNNRASVSRNGNTAPRGNAKSKEKSPQALKKDPVPEKVVGETSTEVKQRESMEGLPRPVHSQDCTPRSSQSLPATESKPTPSGVVISKNRKSIDLNELKKLKNQNNDGGTIRVVDNSKLLEKLLRGAVISVGTKPQLLNSSENSTCGSQIKTEKITSGELEPRTSEIAQPRIEGNVGNPNLIKNSNNPTKQVVEEPIKAPTAKGRNSSSGQPRQPRKATASTRGRRKQQGSQRMPKKEAPKVVESKVDIVEKIIGRRKSYGASEIPAAPVVQREDTHMTTMEPSARPSTSNGIPGHMDLNVFSYPQHNRMAYNWGSLGGTVIRTWNMSAASGLLASESCIQTTPQPVTNNTNSGAELAGINSTLLNPDLKNHDGNISAFVKIPVRSENYSGPTNFVAEAEEVRQSFCDSLTGDGHDSRRGPQQPNEQAAFWSGLQRANNQNANNHQDAVIGYNNHVPNNEAINVNFLRNFLAERQVQHGPILTDNSEFVSLERLAAQHQQSLYNVNNTEVTTPMEQLTQQVHRMSNPPQQINFIPQHHMHAPPPLLPAGVPLPQRSTSFNALNRIETKMRPPPLFEGPPIIHGQAFHQGSPQQMIPRPPALQQCPQIQTGAYQNLAPPQQPRQKVRPAKRSMPAPPPATELPMPKQRRSEPPIKGKSQVSSKDKGKGKASAKAPTINTRASPKKMDPQMVARILSARGITVTPSSSRAANKTQKPQQKNQKTEKQGPAPKTNSTIPQRTQNQSESKNFNNSAGNIRHPGDEIVNTNGGKTCLFVDLTDDEDTQTDINAPGPSVNRFLCHQCGQKFPTAASLELHKETHQAPEPKALRCNNCDLEFSTAEDLERHRLDVHKYRGRGQNWVIPVVDLDYPGAAERLEEYGITNYIPLTLDDDEGTYAIPIIQQETPRRHRDLLGVSNVIVMGHLRSLSGRLYENDSE